MLIVTFSFFYQRNMYALNHKFSRLLNITFHCTASDQKSWLPIKQASSAFNWQIPCWYMQLCHVSKLLASVKCGYISHGEKIAVHFKLALPRKEHRLLIVIQNLALHCLRFIFFWCLLNEVVVALVSCFKTLLVIMNDTVLNR